MIVSVVHPDSRRISGGDRSFILTPNGARVGSCYIFNYGIV
ncbi:hypothetical protein [Phormidium sp. CCY1219]|nr:hypothetical protein [Phormidium sp. CCY1219]